MHFFIALHFYSYFYFTLNDKLKPLCIEVALNLIIFGSV
ncbi:hypothetical protein CSUNSWCD_1119 [Campylobacter showae CSUNSWCD]|uniref:Uncharacterized protein n=1 Tax=Campylobacter showae CSUNSWCD TaxID=1244083 RepID=M5IL16_9BACT|nr:hypothetical protein CSUNSWCD_1119 [Campylobacter showae CSUNSWCD]